MRTAILTVLALAACKGDKDEEPTDDSVPVGTDSDPNTDDSAPDSEEPCLVKPQSIVPEEEDMDWFYRDPIVVTFTGEAPDASFVLFNRDSGEEFATTVSWNASNEIATITETSGALQASMTYGLRIDVCGVSYETAFDTSWYGGPLEGSTESLVGRTYVIEFKEVNFVEPAGFGAFLSLYIDIPVLVGVHQLVGDELWLVGAQGRVDGDGNYLQKKKESGLYVPTWDFTGIDFSGAPYFSADTDLITLGYSGVNIPVHNFHLEGTFAPDGASFAGGKLWGDADTREMGALFGDDSPEYVCELVASVGASCAPCPGDGAEYCLFLKGIDIIAQEAVGLTLERQDENGPIAE